MWKRRTRVFLNARFLSFSTGDQLLYSFRTLIILYVFCMNFPPKLIKKVKCQQIFFGRKNIILRKHSFLLFISPIKFILESLEDCVSCYYFVLLTLRARETFTFNVANRAPGAISSYICLMNKFQMSLHFLFSPFFNCLQVPAFPPGHFISYFPLFKIVASSIFPPGQLFACDQLLHSIECPW